MLVCMVELKVSLFFSYINTNEGRIEFKDVEITFLVPSDWLAINCLIEQLDPLATVTESLVVRQWLNNETVLDEVKALDGQHNYTNDTLDLMKLVQRVLSNLFENRFEKLPPEML
ncbi:Hypothetical protein PHPALM_3495 [Phytophthora palmivora]|uniref:Uncharacterized protein n=1 Tax=Phytophthora palmivora TaxID=4796 RepID=A0A2P4YME6_9STRA|nr:Hypothetical protein PHPALM_3495 [Phytophthora palmivora]